MKCVPIFNSSTCRNRLSKKLICVPADSSAKRFFSARKIESGHTSTCLDENFRRDDAFGETQCESSTNAPLIQSSSERGAAGLSRSTEPRVQEYVRADGDRACPNYGMAKVLDFTGDEKDAGTNRALGGSCARETEIARMDKSAGDGLAEGVLPDYDQYSHLMLWLNDSIPKKRRRPLSFLLSSLVNEEVSV